jgi:hypothetical protein
LCIGDAYLDLDSDFINQGNRFMCVFKRACMSVSSELQSAIGAAVSRVCSNGKVFKDGNPEHLPSGGTFVGLSIEDGEVLGSVHDPEV